MILNGLSVCVYVCIYVNNIILFSVPPASINITGHSLGSRVEIKQNDELELKCKVSGAKPTPTVVWYKRGIPFHTGT